MASHGSVSQFDSKKEDWTSYIERMRHYFIANDVGDAGKKKSILISSCGPKTFRLIRSLLSEEALGASSFDDLVEVVKDYCEPKPSSIVQRYKFNTRLRKQGESIAAYVAALRELAQHCKYGDSLSDMLRDRLVCGVNHAGITRKLLAEKDLTYTKAYETALSIETAEKDTLNFKPTAERENSSGSGSVHLTKKRGEEKKGDSKGSGKKPPPTCYRCGGEHLATVCRFKEAICRYCNKKGHIAKACRGKAKQANFVESNIEQDQDHEATVDTSDEAYAMFSLKGESCDPVVEEVLINGVPVRMELDTGASASIISQETYQFIAAQSEVPPLQNSTLKLTTYTGERIKLLGSTAVPVSYGQREETLVLHVVTGRGPSLMGRDWLSKLEVSIGMINSLEDSNQLDDLLEEYSDVFRSGLGCLQGMKVHLTIDSSVTPKFHKARTVPFVLREKVEAELQRLEGLGIISPVQFSRWAAPIVPVRKKDGSVRICGDYKITVNKASPTETYPLPRVEELFSSLAGGKYYSKLDLSQAYLQLPLDEETKDYVTINTHKGLYRYNRLPFGVSSAPAIFQRCMDSLLKDLKGVAAYIDDIAVTGASLAEHLQNLAAVLGRLKAAGLLLNRAKCSFLQPRIEYLGHMIDADGLHPIEDKVRAIKEAPQPTNVSELRSFLGIINYYHKFLPDLSGKLRPLYELLSKQSKWTWGSKQEQAFEKARNALQRDSLLIHFDPAKPMLLACDASPYGLGAVLSHVVSEGVERPVAYVSRTLTVAEKKYSQLEKEGLAIVFGVKKFHNYLYGRSFVIESDHQPLAYLFSEKKGVPAQASARIQRWALTLGAYSYSIRHKAGKTLGNADALSRLPRPVTTSSDVMPAEIVHLLEHLSTTTCNASNIKEWTAKDTVLSQVYRFVMSGWPTSALPDDFKPYKVRKEELSTQDGCLLWGSRVIVPLPGRARVLAELHETHSGATKMKALARGYTWWPKMDADIESVVKKCDVCQQSRPSPPSAPLHPWEWPAEPWSRLHLDFAGPFLKGMFLVVVDAHSKWLDVRPMTSITSAKTIEQLRIMFSTHGLPKKVVTDNGPSFTSAEFKQFMKENDIIHITSAPYHPSSNGLAERAVQTFKRGIERIQGATVQERLSKFLFTYRITPHTTTGVPPAEMLMGRRLRSKLDSLYPDVSKKVEKQQRRQKQQHDNARPLRSFKEGDRVYAEDFTASSCKWNPGTVVEMTGPLSYTVRLGDGTLVRRHVDNIRRRDAETEQSEESTGEAVPEAAEVDVEPATPPPALSPDPPPPPNAPTTPDPAVTQTAPAAETVVVEPEAPPPTTTITQQVPGSTASSPEVDASQEPPPAPPPSRRSTRQRQSPQWYGRWKT